MVDSKNNLVEVLMLCYGKNGPTLLKNYQLECSATFHKT